MALDRIGVYPFMGVFIILFGWVNAQAFRAEENGSILTVGFPDTLSTACQAALNQTAQCNSTLSFIAFNGLFPQVMSSQPSAPTATSFYYI